MLIDGEAIYIDVNRIIHRYIYAIIMYSHHLSIEKFCRNDSINVQVWDVLCDVTVPTTVLAEASLQIKLFLCKYKRTHVHTLCFRHKMIINTQECHFLSFRPMEFGSSHVSIKFINSLTYFIALLSVFKWL